MMTYSRSIPFALFALFGTGLAQSVDGSKFDKPDGGPPGSYFAAGSSIPVAALKSAAAKATTAAKKATYPINGDSGAKKVTIHSDWSNFSEGAAFVWTADMDVDCDGLDYKCVGNPDGQPQTNFGALAAYEVPFIVIPDTFAGAYESALKGNNIGAVICDGKMFYGIFGDTDGDDPEVIGEASWLMARTCFPNDDLNGNSGHGDADVTYILFTGDESILPSSALTKNYVTNFTTLRSMGDKLMTALAKNLNLSGGGGGSTTTTLKTTTTSSTTPTGGSCEWAGHCAGASCSDENDCSDDLVCKSGKCAAE
ncbi:Fungal chitosanase [Penicillium concentricum]|uniref:Endo-chitosanase n=1 Tax=Penicillium concentricum TaxID=293559 RepID=A0A9W9SW36_9EURO|nr:Fungal chitosanase [Penicillium concentricum]KAJ5383593.1 Fungal chitosanase [Penicillium concentricum]